MSSLSLRRAYTKAVIIRLDEAARTAMETGRPVGEPLLKLPPYCRGRLQPLHALLPTRLPLAFLSKWERLRGWSHASR